MNSIEMIGGYTVIIPKREFELLLKMVNSNQKIFKRSSLSPRAETLANNLVQYHVLDRDDDNYLIRQFKIAQD